VWLTADGEEGVRYAAAAADKAGADDAALGEVGEAARELRETTVDLEAKRDEKIRAAIRQGVSVPKIAKAAALSEGRIYQIRDGRR